MNESREMEVLAVVVHSSLAVLHALGFIYNIRRKNRLDAAIHAAAFIYDTNAVRTHVRSL